MDICSPEELTLPFYGITFWVMSAKSKPHGSSGTCSFSCFLTGELGDN
jgi:hypothetical protein